MFYLFWFCLIIVIHFICCYCSYFFFFLLLLSTKTSFIWQFYCVIKIKIGKTNNFQFLSILEKSGEFFLWYFGEKKMYCLVLRKRFRWIIVEVCYLSSVISLFLSVSLYLFLSLIISVSYYVSLSLLFSVSLSLSCSLSLFLFPRENLKNREGQTNTTPADKYIYVLGLQKASDVTLNCNSERI